MRRTEFGKNISGTKSETLYSPSIASSIKKIRRLSGTIRIESKSIFDMTKHFICVTLTPDCNQESNLRRGTLLHEVATVWTQVRIGTRMTRIGRIFISAEQKNPCKSITKHQKGFSRIVLASFKSPNGVEAGCKK